MNARYLLDTSAASYAITKKSLAFDHHLAKVPMAEIGVSTVTEAELRLLPAPGDLLGGVLFYPSEEAALDGVDCLRATPGLRMLEYLDAASLALMEVPQSAALMIEIEGDADPDAKPEAQLELPERLGMRRHQERAAEQQQSERIDAARPGAIEQPADQRRGEATGERGQRIDRNHLAAVPAEILRDGL